MTVGVGEKTDTNRCLLLFQYASRPTSLLLLLLIVVVRIGLVRIVVVRIGLVRIVIVS